MRSQIQRGGAAIKGLLTSASAAFALTGCAVSVLHSSVADTEFIPSACRVGIYGAAEPFVVLTQRDGAFRYSFSDGRTGAIDDESAVICGVDSVRIDGSVRLKQRPIQITETQFESGGFMLAGQLLEAPGAGPKTTLVVLAHGSEELGWIEAVSYPYQLAGRGVSVFVYDKRGTGKSAGNYSQNFPQLADDLVAASNEAKRLARNRFGRFGLFGFSQGGWIAPLAADHAGADFIGIGYGLVVDILEEDASQVELELREAGFTQDVIAKAKAITDVTARLAVSGYSDGLEELDALREKYGNENWFPQIRGGFTGVILGKSTDELRNKGIPMFDRLNIDWSIKPMEVLREVKVPQLWILAGEDREAPIATTLERLNTLRGEGKEITIFVFPKTDHGMWEFEQATDQSREYSRVTDGYYDLLGDWAEDSLQPPYATSMQE